MKARIKRWINTAVQFAKELLSTDLAIDNACLKMDNDEMLERIGALVEDSAKLESIYRSAENYPNTYFRWTRDGRMAATGMPLYKPPPLKGQQPAPEKTTPGEPIRTTETGRMPTEHRPAGRGTP